MTRLTRRLLLLLFTSTVSVIVGISLWTRLKPGRTAEKIPVVKILPVDININNAAEIIKEAMDIINHATDIKKHLNTSTVHSHDVPKNPVPYNFTWLSKAERLNASTLRSHVLKYFLPKKAIHPFYKKGAKDNYKIFTPKYEKALCGRDCSFHSSFGILNRVFGKCAVIGNGGILRGSNCGKEIDGMDFVLRFNLATLKGYKQDVGYKTSVMSLNQEGLSWIIGNITNGTDIKGRKAWQNNLDFIPKDTVFWHCKHAKVSRGYLRGIYDILDRTSHKPRLAFATTDNVASVTNAWDIKYPTSGLIGLTFAAAICKSVTAYGFYPFYFNDNNKPISNHYYEADKFNFTSDTIHSYNVEFELLRHLNRTGAIRLVTRPCSS